MKNLKIATMSLVLGLMVSSSSLYAKSFSFENYDLNKDTKITQEEFNKVRTERMMKRASEGRKLKNVSKAPLFEVIDKNSDGTINKQEFNSFKSKRVGNKKRKGQNR